MNFLSAAKVLDELMLELIEKGAQLPPHLSEDLKTGRALSNMAARSSDGGDFEMKIAPVLESVEMNLLALAELHGGAAYADGWQNKLAGAYQEPAQAVPAKTLPGAPKGEHWIRVKTADLPDVRPADFMLTAVEQADGYTLIYGNQENISALLKEIRQKLGKVGFKRSN